MSATHPRRPRPRQRTPPRPESPRRPAMPAAGRTPYNYQASVESGVGRIPASALAFLETYDNHLRLSGHAPPLNDFAWRDRLEAGAAALGPTVDAPTRLLALLGRSAALHPPRHAHTFACRDADDELAHLSALLPIQVGHARTDLSRPRLQRGGFLYSSPFCPSLTCWLQGAEMRRLVLDGASTGRVFGIESDARRSEAGALLFGDAALMAQQVRNTTAPLSLAAWPPLPPTSSIAVLIPPHPPPAPAPPTDPSGFPPAAPPLAPPRRFLAPPVARATPSAIGALPR